MKVSVRLAKDVVIWLREIERISHVPLDQVVAVLLTLKAKELKYERPRAGVRKRATKDRRGQIS